MSDRDERYKEREEDSPSPGDFDSSHDRGDAMSNDGAENVSARGTSEKEPDSAEDFLDGSEREGMDLERNRNQAKEATSEAASDESMTSTEDLSDGRFRSDERDVRRADDASAPDGAEIEDASSEEASPSEDGEPSARTEEDAAPSSDQETTNERPAMDKSQPDGSQIGFIPRITIGAFAESDGVRKTLSALSGDRRVSRAALDLHEGGLKSAIEAFEDGPTPDLIIAETRLEGDALFDALERLAGLCPPGTRLILIGHNNDIALYRKLLKFGVGDYIVAPLEPLAVIDAVSQLFQEGDAEVLGKVTAFFGARGGAGASTIARNVAAAIAKGCDSAVLIADMDLPFGTIAFDLDLDPTQGIRDALDEGDRLEETLIDRLITRRDERVGLLAAPATLKLDAEPDPETVHLFIERARTLTPHLLLDLPHCWSDWVRKALHLVDEIVLVATPDLVALRNARNIVSAARSARRNDPTPRLVLNQIGMPKRREARSEDFERVLDLEPVAEIPFDSGAFADAAMKGELIAETRANPAAAEAFQAIARVLTGKQINMEQSQRSVLARLFKRSA